MNELFELIKGLLSSNGGAFGAVALIGWFIFWAHGKVLGIIHNHGSIKDSCCKNEKDMQDIKENIVYIKGTLATIVSMVGKEALFKSQSPVSLTDSGRKAADELVAESIIARNWEAKIFPCLKKELSGKNPYDVQQYCMEKIPVSPAIFFDDGSLNDVKLYAFKSGLTLFACMQMMGVLIRDKYLSSVGVPIEAIDLHAPKK